MTDTTLRIAIIGSGISGLYLAQQLKNATEFVIFEANNYAGGHTNTVDAELDGETIAVDTGFIVHNDRNYPLFIELIESLGVQAQDGDMSFGFSCEATGLEYCGSSLNTLFAQRGNLFNAKFIGMLREIVRFNKLADQLIAAPDDVNLGEFLSAHAFQGPVIDDYLVPMAAAIWSSKPAEILDFPASYFGHFFRNHGLLTINDRPQWRTITGGSRKYVAALTNDFGERLRLNTPVQRVERHSTHAIVHTGTGGAERFDQVVFACHSDQALELLADASPAEAEILGAIPFQANDTVLHTDTRLLPANPRAWASWNYHRFADQGEEVCVTYDMSHLQQLSSPRRLLVTLNATSRINPDSVLRRIHYEHPVYNSASVAARRRWREISNVNNTHYCGAYWGYGFHEDGARSAQSVAADILGNVDTGAASSATNYA